MLVRGDVVEYVTETKAYAMLNGHVGVVTNSTPEYHNLKDLDEPFYAIQWISDYMATREQFTADPPKSGHWSEILLNKIGHIDLDAA